MEIISGLETSAVQRLTSTWSVRLKYGWQYIYTNNFLWIIRAYHKNQWENLSSLESSCQSPEISDAFVIYYWAPRRHACHTSEYIYKIWCLLKREIKHGMTKDCSILTKCQSLQKFCSSSAHSNKHLINSSLFHFCKTFWPTNWSCWTTVR